MAIDDFASRSRTYKYGYHRLLIISFLLPPNDLNAVENQKINYNSSHRALKIYYIIHSSAHRSIARRGTASVRKINY